MENEYQFYFCNSIGTLLEKTQFIEFNSISSAIPRVDKHHFNIGNYASCVLGVEDKGRNMEKELRAILEELPISLSLNLSLMTSFKGLKIKERFPSCSQFVQLARIIQRNEKWLRLEKSDPTSDDSPAPIVASRLLPEISWKSTP
ncbi:hypothetical protein M9H77_12769 [Catharanthus roseus]|uniref:Uncharacterized protein n=1 Tax=Catharanthus roseus TaxID=4058 RepID=A0ACC0BIE6_CATRO|nr:hypothetical protein M9H77_12769 [Catharanthus roseus]